MEMQKSIESILKSDHFKNKKDWLRDLFEEVANIVINEYYDKNNDVKIKAKKNYIAFYKKSNGFERIFLSIRITMNNLHASLKIDNPSIRNQFGLEKKSKKNRRDEGDFDFNTITEFKDKLPAIKYSYANCDEK